MAAHMVFPSPAPLGLKAADVAFSYNDSTKVFSINGKTCPVGGTLLGAGSYGEARLVSVDGARYVIKKSTHKLNETADLAAAEREAGFCKRIYGMGEGYRVRKEQHTYAGFPPEVRYEHYTLMPYVEGRSLYDCAIASPSYRTFLKIHMGALKALQNEVHAKGIAHLDIHNTNIMVKETKGTVEVKFIDFNLSCDLGKTFTVPMSLNLRVKPPEYKRGQPIEAKAEQDIYCLGLTLLPILQTCVRDMPAHIRIKLERIYASMCSQNPAERMSLADAIRTTEELALLDPTLFDQTPAPIAIPARAFAPIPYPLPAVVPVVETIADRAQKLFDQLRMAGKDESTTLLTSLCKPLDNNDLYEMLKMANKNGLWRTQPTYVQRTVLTFLYETHAKEIGKNFFANIDQWCYFQRVASIQAGNVFFLQKLFDGFLNRVVGKLVPYLPTVGAARLKEDTLKTPTDLFELLRAIPIVEEEKEIRIERIQALLNHLKPIDFLVNHPFFSRELDRENNPIIKKTVLEFAKEIAPTKFVEIKEQASFPLLPVFLDQPQPVRSEPPLPPVLYSEVKEHKLPLGEEKEKLEPLRFPVGFEMPKLTPIRLEFKDNKFPVATPSIRKALGLPPSDAKNQPIRKLSISKTELKNLLYDYQSTSWLGKCCFFNPLRSVAMRKLHELTKKDFIHEDEISSAIVADSGRRLSLFDTGNEEKANKTSTDAVILSLSRHFSGR